ncbi:MAG TPA: hypothetical protein RMH99_00805 [Sandaracinaceae bacterium LLY-WYZ-13_1]|nr:hypothetical protein [Sandaracinaceae bacterium LLY-WYZ-13_1]
MTRSDPATLLVPSLLLATGLVAFVACGGSDVEEDPPPVCYASHPVPDSGVVRNLDAEEWADLVVRGFSEGTTTSQNCVGDPIRWRPTDPSCAVHEDEDEPAPEPQPVTEASVVVGRSDHSIGTMTKPVWVITHTFEDGDGFGPVAITERTAEGVAVRAIGSLRMPVDRARLRLRESGGQRVLVADGERCPPEDEDAEDQPTNLEPGEGEEGEDEEPTCIRYARLMPVVGDRIMSPEIRSRSSNECLGPARVYLSREETVALENGWERTFELAASMEYRAGAVIVHEQVTATDRDPRDPGRPGRLFRTTDGDRVILLRRGGMVSEGAPLFERALRADGSTQLPIAETEGDEEQSGSDRGPSARN